MTKKHTKNKKRPEKIFFKGILNFYMHSKSNLKVRQPNLRPIFVAILDYHIDAKDLMA